MRTLGHGGMAQVYLAFDEKKREEVAIKVMREDLMDDPEFVQRFATEARAAASLDHPNIVRVSDYGQDGDLRYIVQEYVRGSTLKDLIYEQGGLNWQLAVPLLIQIALALQHAHSRGIIHRDMKPQNVLVTPDMVAKVTDFGIARAQSVNTITLTGGVAFGSVHYFSPEQARGEQVTVRSDLYSLGIILYEMVTGELPFDGESSVAVAIQQLQEMPRRPSSINPEIPPALDDIIFRSIQKRPERRYASASDFANELDAFMIDPQGVYGVIPRHASPNPEAPSTSALGLQKQESNYDKVREIEEKIAERRRSRLLSGILVFILVIACATALVMLLYRGYQEISERIVTPVASEEFVVGRYQGRPLDEVRQELTEAGVDVEVIYEKNATVQLGYIFKQEPDNGIKLQADELKVRLYVSRGEEQIPIPYLLGLSSEAAIKQLKSLGFDVLERKEFSKTVKRGEVIRTDPEANREAKPGSMVYLYVSDGETETVMPQLYEGIALAEATRLLQEANIDWQLVPVDDKVDPSLRDELKLILGSSIEPGTKVQAGTKVILAYGSAEDLERIKRGEEEESEKNELGIVNGKQIQVPSLVGFSYVGAIEQLLNLGWPKSAIRVSMTEAADAAGASDQYVIQVNPSPGSQVTIGHHEIELVIGTYSEWVSGRGH